MILPFLSFSKYLFMDQSEISKNESATIDWLPLDHARLLLHINGLLLEQVNKIANLSGSKM
jgi:hypothetical protein